MATSNVLVVEDDEAVRRLIVEYLRSTSLVNIRGARDGVEALHEMSQARYAVIVLDLMMPKMSGMDFLDSLSARTSDPSVKTLDEVPAVIVITSAPSEDIPNDTIENRSCLVRHVLRKPLDLAALADSVNAVLWPE